jgi:hypothetical protein
MSESGENDQAPIFCQRCQRELVRGDGSFYVVRIEAFADPTPPHFTEEDLARDPRAEMDRLLDEMRHLSEQEAMDQVYRTLTIYLCRPCYCQWIENPAG